ncbi:hypothetical protein HDU81_009796 [Chytriomyces hyalinus]|nr:hypothetical protein HDU81_009796 [Chytriomyces hyalinus]
MQYIAILTASLLSLAHAQTTSSQAPTTTTSTTAPPSKECAAARTKFSVVWSNCGLPETTTVAAILVQPSFVKCMCDSYSIVEADVTSCENDLPPKDLAAAKQFLVDLKQRCPADAQTSVKTSAQASAQTTVAQSVAQTSAQSSVKSGAAGGNIEMSFASAAMVAACALVF